MSNLNREDVDPQGTQEWIESLEDEIEERGFERTRHLLEKLVDLPLLVVRAYPLTQTLLL